MYSRARKLPRCDTDAEALHKQINNDFEVQEYLHEHQTEHNNTDAYATLLNSLILHRKKRVVKLHRLQVAHAAEDPQPDTPQHLEFQGLEERTGKEYEIRKNLEREIVEIKKSLNLLKGDIGHLVLRNESSQLLGSKVGKAKIVAEDQLKRVALALAKDREEIKLRNQMQKKFNKKLKNVSSYEVSGLTKTENHYVEGQVRKEEAYKKLLSSQKTAQNGQEMAILLTVKQKLDSNNQSIQQDLMQLQAIAGHFSLRTIEWPESITSLYSQVQHFIDNLTLPASSSEQDIEQAVEVILSQYEYQKESIKAMSQFYEAQLNIKDELMLKLRECQGEERALLSKFEAELLQKYQVSEEQLADFHGKLKRYSSLIKTYFFILGYLEQHLFSKDEPLQRRNSIYQPTLSYSYITQLHTVYKYLSSDQLELSFSVVAQLTEQKTTLFFEGMLKDIKKWLSQLQNQLIKEGKGNAAARMPYCKPTFFARKTQVLEPLLSTSVHEDSFSMQQSSEVETVKEVESSSKAKRIKLLEDVDINYYKMIKATMRMEKENTRKNYEFLRTWKRAKYASRDEILEEKRFQASFSVLVTPQISPIHTTGLKFGAGSMTTSKMINQNSKTMHSTGKFLVKAKAGTKVSTPATAPLKRIRSSMLEVRERKSRLTEKLKIALDFS